MDTIVYKINEIIKLGYTYNQVIKMSVKFPQIFNLNVENLKKKIDEMVNLGYKYKDVIVVHRVINKIEKDGVFYYTKGDANLVQDNYVVKQEDIVGVVEEIIPYVGLPAVWLNGL
jgi:signal peptidase I